MFEPKRHFCQAKAVTSWGICMGSGGSPIGTILSRHRTFHSTREANYGSELRGLHHPGPRSWNELGMRVYPGPMYCIVSF